jgi:hypothetical protein
VWTPSVVALAAFGYLNPVLAALIHVSSETIFVLNSARLLSRPSKDPRPASSCAGTPIRTAGQTAA